MASFTGYSRFLVRCHCLVLVLTTLVAAGCIAAAFIFREFPSLEDPTLGFMSRGTKIKGRKNAVENLFTSNEVTYRPSFTDMINANANPKERRKRDANPKERKRKKRDVSVSCYFRIITGDNYFKLAFASPSGANLWSLKAIQEMCAMDTRLVQTSPHLAYNPNHCPSHSLGYYIGWIRNRTTCEKLTEEDLSATLQLLKRCSPYYYRAWEINSNYIDPPAPMECQHQALYNILNELTDSEFLGKDSPNNEQLTYATMWLELEEETNRDFYLDVVHSADLTGTHLEVIGVDARNRFPIFFYFLFREMTFFIVGMALIFIIMAIYCKSALLTIFTLFDVIFSFGIAYFFYMVPFAIPHMPALGFPSTLILIAVVADDVFIIYDAYELARELHPQEDMAYWMAEALRHAALSILVTSLTTGAALYANIVSDITDIKGFGIISGTAIVVNYFLVITWIPASIITVEKLNKCCFSRVNCCSCFTNCMAKCKNLCETIFNKFLPACVSKLWFVWLIIFFELGVGGVVVTFVKPKLNLPTSQDYALFSRDSPIEVWFQDLKYKFRFYQRVNTQRTSAGIILLALWGVKDEDNGNHLDPMSNGDLEFDSSFDLSQPENQMWMRSFCHDLLNASFVDKSETKGLQCSLDIFNSYLTKSCESLKTQLGENWIEELNDCCGLTGIPIESHRFKTCHYHFTDMVFSGILNVYDSFGFAFYSATSNEMKAYSYMFTSTQGWTAHFQTMNKFYTEVQDWMEDKLSMAPTRLKEGFMTSRYEHFDLLDLQLSLASGTYAAIGVSMAAAFGMMLVTSRNAVITFYAILTIFLIISVCAGTLVLLGWELNVVESVILTMSVGLSIDFCIHYGMGYRLSAHRDRKLRVNEAFKKVGPAICMAASTTFIAGACVMPSVVLFYVQLGKFLMLVMAFGWLFSTFFFQSLLYVLGPNGDFCVVKRKKGFTIYLGHQNPAFQEDADIPADERTWPFSEYPLEVV